MEQNQTNPNPNPEINNLSGNSQPNQNLPQKQDNSLINIILIQIPIAFCLGVSFLGLFVLFMIITEKEKTDSENWYTTMITLVMGLATSIALIPLYRSFNKMLRGKLKWLMIVPPIIVILFLLIIRFLSDIPNIH